MEEMGKLPNICRLHIVILRISAILFMRPSFSRQTESVMEWSITDEIVDGVWVLFTGS